MKKSKQVVRLSILAGSAVLIGLFQNCGQRMMFQTSSDLQKASFIPIVDEGGLGGAPGYPSDIQNPNPNENNSNQSGNTDLPQVPGSSPEILPPAEPPTVVETPTTPTTQPTSPVSGGNQGSQNPEVPGPGNPGGQNPGNPSAGNPGNGNPGGNGNSPAARQRFACILEGPGNSVRLGLANNSLGGQNAVPSSVCMSSEACSEIVSQRFPVKYPLEAGYCNNNPNVIHLSDEQVSELISQ